MKVIALRADALARLVEAQLPCEVEARGPGDAWPLVGPALLAHATRTLRSIIALAPHGAHNDGFRLLRSLYDHVVTFAWLAADPPERLARWRLEDLRERLKADREAAAAGEPLFDAATRIEVEKELASATVVDTPDLASKALAADRHWATKIPSLDPGQPRSFRRYTFLFRTHSGLIHATFRGLNRVTEDISPIRKRVVLQAPLEGSGPYGMATVVYGLGLFVAAETLGWPAANEVNGAFDRYPDV